jgi:hypothetical protein
MVLGWQLPEICLGKMSCVTPRSNQGYVLTNFQAAFDPPLAVLSLVRFLVLFRHK